MDTGCETNLIKIGLVPDCFFQPAVRPITFLAANKTTVSGGQRQLTCILHLAGTDVDTSQPETLAFPCVCHDADIRGLEMLISYKWLAEHHMDIIPSRHGLSIQQPTGPVWVPGTQQNLCNLITTTLTASINLVTGQPPSDEPTNNHESDEYALRGDVFKDAIHRLAMTPTLDYFATLPTPSATGI